MLFKWTGDNGTTSLSNHIQRCHPNTYTKEHVAAYNSSESREERAQALLLMTITTVSGKSALELVMSFYYIYIYIYCILHIPASVRNRGFWIFQFSKLRMDIFFRMNNTRNCSREVLEYLIFHISPRKCFGGSGEQRYDFQREAVCTYAYEYFALKKMLPLAPSSFLPHNTYMQSPF